MAENEQAIIEAAAIIHDVNPKYASAFLDGVRSVMNALGDAEESVEPEEEQKEGE